MPTGYTADVCDGKTTDFATFAMRCARAFGALVTMRGDPAYAEIPSRIEPSDYNAKMIAEATFELDRLNGLSLEEREIEAREAYEKAAASWDRHEAKKAETRRRYEEMLVHVHAWHPPTSDHEELKKFMIDQLEESIRLDCGPAYSKRPEPVSVDDWFAAALSEANRNVAYYAKAQAAEIELSRERTKWIADLRASLSPKHETA